MNKPVGRVLPTAARQGKKQADFGILSDHRNACYGFCAIWIVVFHAYQLGCDFSFGIQWLAFLNTFAVLGNLGVDVFIFLSGVSCFFAWSKSRNPGIFLHKRLKRVIPSLLLICGSFWLIWAVTGRVAWSWVLYNLTILLPILTDGSQSIWYVAAIILFYALYPYVHHAIYGAEEIGGGYSERKLLFRLFLCIMVTCYLFWMLHRFNLPLFNNIAIAIGRLPTFCMGSYFGHLVYKRSEISRRSCICYTMAIFAYCLYCLFAYQLVSASIWWWWLTLAPGGVLLSLLLCAVFEGINRCSAASMIEKGFSFFGRFSLELYLMHIMCFWSRGLLPRVDGNHVAALMLAVLACLGAYLVNRLLCKWMSGDILSVIAHSHSRRTLGSR